MFIINKSGLALVLLVLTTAFTGTSIASDHNASKAAPSKFVGTFYTSGPSGGAMVTIHADGTMEHIYENMFNRGNRRVTPALGVWRQSGNSEIKVTWLRFATEQFGDNFSPNGQISRISYSMVFDKPVQGRCPGYTVDSVWIELFQPGQNPVTDEPVLSFEAPSNSTGVRLEVE